MVHRIEKARFGGRGRHGNSAAAGRRRSLPACLVFRRQRTCPIRPPIKVYLLKDPAETAFAKGGFKSPKGTNIVTAMNAACEKKTPACQTAFASTAADSVTVAKTDENGKATLPAVLPGVYCLFGIGRFEGRALVWDVKVESRSGIILSRLTGAMAPYWRNSQQTTRCYKRCFRTARLCPTTSARP
jgi:hypothetical protein